MFVFGWNIRVSCGSGRVDSRDGSPTSWLSALGVVQAKYTDAIHGTAMPTLVSIVSEVKLCLVRRSTHGNGCRRQYSNEKDVALVLDELILVLREFSRGQELP
jgi:hypothetical protein